jgi:molecular chaperone GrpE (heat shock protein)
LAAAICKFAHRPLELWEAAALIACVGLAGWSIIYPVLRRYTDSLAAGQTSALTGTVAQINRLEGLAAQIAGATAQWQTVQGCAAKISDSSKEVLQSMDAQIKTFGQTLEKANDAEKAHLRLETDKLRRSELEWLQVLIRVMDHVYALFVAAARSGQPNLIGQLGQFQEACRDSIRRIGLAPIVVTPGTQFDPQIHQLLDEAATPPPDAIVETTLVTGFTYQGQLVRRAVVDLRQAPAADQAPAEPAAPTPEPGITGELGL